MSLTQLCTENLGANKHSLTFTKLSRKLAYALMSIYNIHVCRRKTGSFTK